MPEDAFERFRRLRGLATQHAPSLPAAQEAMPLEDGVLVDSEDPLEGKGDEQVARMTPLGLLRALHARGVKMTPYPEGKVRCRASQAAWTPTLLEALNIHQVAVADLLEAFEERAAIAAYYGGLLRAEAERLAWQYVLDETPEQSP